MNELDILFPAPVMLQAGGETLAVLPLRVRQLAPAMRALAPLVGFFHLDTQEVDIDGLLQHPDTPRLVATATGRTDSWAAALPRDQLLNALLLVIGCNQDFFFPDASAIEGDPPANPLADSIQGLISNGHRWPDIEDYTLAQVALFSGAAWRLQREADRTALLSARAAAAPVSVFKGMLKALGDKEQSNGE